MTTHLRRVLHGQRGDSHERSFQGKGGSAMTPTTMAICRACWEQGEGFYLPAAEAGSWCENEHDGKFHKLVKRRLYICDDAACEEALAFTTLGDLERHRKRDHDDWREV